MNGSCTSFGGEVRRAPAPYAETEGVAGRGRDSRRCAWQSPVGLIYLVAVLGVQFVRGELTDDALTPTHLIVTDVLGLLMSGLGGFVAGRLARIDEVQHGAATGFGSLVVWLLIESMLQTEGTQSWREVFLSLAVVPVAALGGYGAAHMNARTARQST